MNENEKLVEALDAANDRADKAYANWDIEAYEGACRAAERIYAMMDSVLQWAYISAM